MMNKEQAIQKAVGETAAYKHRIYSQTEYFQALKEASVRLREAWGIEAEWEFLERMRAVPMQGSFNNWSGD